MLHKEELELMRHGVTPAQFLSYVRYQIRRHKLTAICAEDITLQYFAGGYDSNFDIKYGPDGPCKEERSVSKPYELQTYIRNHDGTVYNHIMEFNFDDEKTGYGYFYFINTWND